MKDTVFIQTNHRQLLGAMVSAYSLHRNSESADMFDVRILRAEEFPFLAAREGQEFLRDGGRQTWMNDDLQSFTPLRFLAPELMNYEGRAVVIDPDIFAVGDVAELFRRELGGKAIWCRQRPGKVNRPGYLASSVMLLDCTRLGHWRCARDFDEMFAFERDYSKWMKLELEPRDSIGILEEEWNHFDTLNDRTRLLHNTKRRTQPWKTGLPIEYGNTTRNTHWGVPTGWIKRAKYRLMGDGLPYGRYQTHPDPAQERLFFSLLRQAIDDKAIAEDVVRAEMDAGHIRPDAFDMVERTRLPEAA